MAIMDASKGCPQADLQFTSVSLVQSLEHAQHWSTFIKWTVLWPLAMTVPWRQHC